MKYLNLILVFLFITTSCSHSSDKDSVKKIVDEWQGKQINLPENMTDFLTGDTIDITDADFTIVSYVDSIGCTGCKMKLPLWKEFLSSLDSVSNYDIRFLMVVSPSGENDLPYFLKSADFNYPVYIDYSDKVSKANSFPAETALQTFLLDRNKNVRVVGNPVYSSEIAKLYKKIISGQMSVSEGDIVSVSDNQISLGTLAPQETWSREIIFSNQGNDTIHIKKVISSCDCTELSLPERYIRPKSDLKAVLHFAGDTVSGDFERSVYVYYSDFEYPTIITISGKIIH